MSLKNLPIFARPREKLLEKGAANLKDYELLAILLRTGVKGKSAIDLAKDILAKNPITKLLDVNAIELKRIKGIDKSKIATLLAAFELTKRATGKLDNTLPIIDSPQKALDQLTEIRNKKKEYFVVLYLNARNQLIHKEVISIGILNASLVHPREVFEPAIKYLATSLILAHNHPSGETEASEDDLLLTRRLADSGKLLGIEVVDHLIVSKDGMLSLKHMGILSTL